jgi:hypothetical protein
LIIGFTNPRLIMEDFQDLIKELEHIKATQKALAEKEARLQGRANGRAQGEWS